MIKYFEYKFWKSWWSLDSFLEVKGSYLPEVLVGDSFKQYFGNADIMTRYEVYRCSNMKSYKL